MMSLRFHEIAEGNHRILNPFSEDKLMLLGEICNLHETTRILDLACGRGELLCRWAQAHRIMGTGVDISEVFLEAARARARELDVWSKLNWVVGDAAEYPQPFHQFNVVSCIGATWIGGGLVGTLALMKQALRDDDGLLLVGEAYWREDPPDAALQALDIARDTFTTLGGLSERFDLAGVEPIEMLISSHDEWDRYYASQWKSVHNWLRDHPDDPDADDLRRWIDHNRRAYLQYERDYLGWGVFVLKVVTA